LFNFDLLFLRYLKGSEAAGAYAAAYTFIAFASNLLVAYAHGVMPSLTRSASAPSAHVPVYESAQAQVIALALPAALGGAVVAGALMQLVFGAAFGAGEVALRWLSLSLPFAALREVAVVAVVVGGGERRLVRVNFVVVVCNVLLNVALVPLYGLRGAALATLATEIVRLLLVARIAATLGYEAPLTRRLAKPVAAGLAMLLVLQVTGPAPLWRALVAGAVSYGGVLTLLGGIRFRRGAWPTLTI
jgi:O-antigen/teichoic acid export membrane protein